MKKSDILKMVNARQNKLNSFRNVTENDLKKAQKAIRAMCWFGWKETKAAEIITTGLADGAANWYPGYMVREMENSSRKEAQPA